MVQDLGYHDLAAQGTANIVDRAQAYVFWTAFFMDTNLSLGACRMGAQRRADTSTPLPEADTGDWWSLHSPEVAGSSPRSNIFSLLTRLAVIQAETLEELFSVSARRRPQSAMGFVRADLLAKLHAWRRDNVLPHIDAEELSRSVHRLGLVHCLMLESAHFRTVYQLQATEVLRSCLRPLSIPSCQVLEGVVELGFPGCAKDARRLLALAALISQRAVSTTWCVRMLNPNTMR